MPGKKPFVSVIIPTLNEEKYIRYPLDGLRWQTFRDFEIIVVDSYSTDRTRDIALKHAKVIERPKRGMSNARNNGARIAKGSILIFIDADTMPERETLKAYVSAFEDRNIVAATGPMRPLERATPFIRLSYLLLSVYLSRLLSAFGRLSISGSNFAVRRDAFENAGGFDEKLVTNESHSLSRKLRKYGRVSYVDGARVRTSVRRITRWGLFRYLVFRLWNNLGYALMGNAAKEYEQIR